MCLLKHYATGSTAQAAFRPPPSALLAMLRRSLLLAWQFTMRDRCSGSPLAMQCKPNHHHWFGPLLLYSERCNRRFSECVFDAAKHCDDAPSDCVRVEFYYFPHRHCTPSLNLEIALLASQDSFFCAPLKSINIAIVWINKYASTSASSAHGLSPRPKT